MRADFVFYFDFAKYRKMLGLAWRETNPKIRVYYLCILLGWVPVVSSFHALCFALDPLLFPALRRVPLRAPVFVVGHARSGTTLVHRLMSQDEGRFSAFLLYELYFPSLLQKKLIRRVAQLDARLLGGALEARVRAWETRRYAAMKGVHDMGLTKPEEDDLIFYYSCASGYWITKMPYMGDLDFYSVDGWPAAKRKRLMDFYRACVQRQLVLNGSERIHLSKNPVFAGRVEALIEAFPDARFVVPIRNPNETIPSLLQLMGTAWKGMGWDAARQQHCLGILAEQSFDTYLHPLAVLEAHPETRCAVVDYRDLVSNPADTIRDVYAALDLELSDGFATKLAGAGRRAATHVSTHAYSLEAFGLEADAIAQRLSNLFERYGWDRADPSANIQTKESSE
jgi:hypothetical protein